MKQENSDFHNRGYSDVSGKYQISIQRKATKTSEKTLITYNPVSKQRRPWSDCANAQSDQAFAVRICPAEPFLTRFTSFWYGKQVFRSLCLWGCTSDVVQAQINVIRHIIYHHYTYLYFQTPQWPQCNIPQKFIFLDSFSAGALVLLVK